MITTILFDVDGVLIKSSDELFSTKYSRDFNIPIETITPFVKNEAKLCKIGKANLKEELGKYVSMWKWNKSVDDLIKYWYESERVINTQLLSEINNLRQRGLKCYVASDNEKYRSEMIISELEVNKHFDGAFFSYQLGVTKAETHFFKTILSILKINQPSEVVLCDDKQRNIDVAKQVGINGLLFDKTSDFVNKIDSLAKSF